MLRFPHGGTEKLKILRISQKKYSMVTKKYWQKKHLEAPHHEDGTLC
jgi:hypothetical protein